MRSLCIGGDQENKSRDSEALYFLPTTGSLCLAEPPMDDGKDTFFTATTGISGDGELSEWVACPTLMHVNIAET